MTDTRNVTDYYKNWELEAIRADLDKRRSPVIQLTCNLTNDFNKASVIRASNAFAVRKTIIAGKKRYDPRGTVGTRHYEHLEHWDDPIAAICHYQDNENYTAIPVENDPQFHPESITNIMYKYMMGQEIFPKEVLFVYGEEGLGLSKEIVQSCKGNPVYINQYGSVRSLNISQASAIMLHAYDFIYPNSMFASEDE